jgi:hypothetical protein
METARRAERSGIEEVLRNYKGKALMATENLEVVDFFRALEYPNILRAACLSASDVMLRNPVSADMRAAAAAVLAVAAAGPLEGACARLDDARKVIRRLTREPQDPPHFQERSWLECNYRSAAELLRQEM